MNKINYLNVFTVLLFLGALSLQRLQAQNRPVVQTKFTADPAPMVHNGTVYLYTSHDEDDAPEGMGRFLMKEWLLYSSTDMVNWTDHGAVASLKNFEWTENKENGAWAPMAAKVMAGMFEKSKELNILDKTVKITCALNDASVAQIEELANELA